MKEGLDITRIWQETAYMNICVKGTLGSILYQPIARTISLENFKEANNLLVNIKIGF